MDQITYTPDELLKLMVRFIDWLIDEGWIGHKISEYLDAVTVRGRAGRT